MNVFTHLWIISLVFISPYPMHINWSLCSLFLCCCTLWFVSLYYATHQLSVCCTRCEWKRKIAFKNGGDCSMQVPCSIYAWYIIMYNAITIMNYRHDKHTKKLHLTNTKRCTQHNHTFMLYECEINIRL